MKALVTGASGFIGKHVVRQLQEDEIQVVTTDTHGSPDVLLDLSHDRLSELPSVDVVVHLAANADVGKFTGLPATLTLDTLQGTVNLLSWSRDISVQAFILLSTSEVYGDIDDDDPPSLTWKQLQPSTVYGASKAAQEVLAIGWGRSYGFHVTIINTMNVFGLGQPEQRFVPVIVKKLLQGEEVPIAVTDKAEVTSRCWTPVEDVAESVSFMCQEFQMVDALEKFHVVGPELDCKQFVEKIASILGVKPTFTYFHYDRPGYEKRYALNGERIKQYLGFEPHQTFDERLTSTVQALKEKYETR